MFNSNSQVNIGKYSQPNQPNFEEGNLLESSNNNLKPSGYKTTSSFYKKTSQDSVLPSVKKERDSSQRK